jgi:GNAT superfamily N-acetyltransferase
MTIHIKPVLPTELEGTAPMLTSLLHRVVNGGSPLGFLPPLSALDAHTYWLSLAPELQQGTRLLLVAFTQQGPAGAAQLVLSTAPNGRHRAEIQKLFVANEVRGNGVGRALITALHYAARRSHRSLIVLNTRRGEPAEAFYRRLGYREVGVIPGWTVGPQGERYDHVTLYHELGHASLSSRVTRLGTSVRVRD